MLGTHYSSLSELLVNDAKTILQKENPSNQGNITWKIAMNRASYISAI